MRKLVYEVLTASASLALHIAADGWYEEGSIVDTPMQRPFVILKLSGTPRGVRAVSTLEVWCYDERGDYSRIDDFLRALKAFFSTMSEQQRTRSDSSVVRLVLADWQGDSADLYDDIFRCGTRYASWRLVGAGQ